MISRKSLKDIWFGSTVAIEVSLTVVKKKESPGYFVSQDLYHH